MRKIFIFAGFSQSLILFRSDLITSWLKKGYDVIAAAPGRDSEEQVKSLGASYHNITLERTGLNPITDLVFLFRLHGLIKRERPDTFFLYTIKPVIYGSFVAYLFKHCRVFSMITGLGYVFTDELTRKQYIKKLVVSLYRFALKRNEKVFFQNPDDIEYFIINDIVKSEKVIKVNGSGVNIDHFYEAPFGDGPVVFLLIARLLREKGVAEYIEAAKVIKDKYPEIMFKLIGWTFHENPSAIDDEKVSSWRNEGVVDIISETKDVRPFIEQSSIYVLPSYREGTPRTVLEAMAMGRPIITTDAPGCRETVIEGLNGFLVPIKDSRALANAMEKFILKPELIKKMGKESRKLAEEKYDVHKVNAVINRAMGLF